MVKDAFQGVLPAATAGGAALKSGLEAAKFVAAKTDSLPAATISGAAVGLTTYAVGTAVMTPSKKPRRGKKDKTPAPKSSAKKVTFNLDDRPPPPQVEVAPRPPPPQVEVARPPPQAENVGYLCSNDGYLEVLNKKGVNMLGASANMQDKLWYTQDENGELVKLRRTDERKLKEEFPGVFQVIQ